MYHYSTGKPAVFIRCFCTAGSALLHFKIHMQAENSKIKIKTIYLPLVHKSCHAMLGLFSSYE